MSAEEDFAVLADDYLDDLLFDEDGLGRKENCGRAPKKTLTAAPRGDPTA